MHLRTRKWGFLIFILSSVSGVFAAANPSTDDYYEEYEDESPQNATNYKLNVPESFKNYLEDLLSKGNATKGDTGNEKVTSSKPLVEKKEEDGRSKKQLGLNQNLSSKTENQIDVGKTLQSVADALETSGALNSSRTKIYHPYASSNISQLLSSLGKGSALSNLRSFRHKHKHSPSNRNIGNLHTKITENLSKNFIKDVNDLISSKEFLRKNKLINQVQPANTALEPQPVQFSPSSRLKYNLPVAPFNGFKNKPSPKKPETITKFEPVLPTTQTTNKKLDAKAESKTPGIKGEISKFDNNLQSSTWGKVHPDKPDVFESYKNADASGSVNSNNKSRELHDSLNDSKTVVRNHGVLSEKSEKKSVKTGSDFINLLEPNFDPINKNLNKQYNRISNDQSDQFTTKSQDDFNSFDDLNQSSSLSVKQQTDTASNKTKTSFSAAHLLKKIINENTNFNLTHINKDTSNEKQGMESTKNLPSSNLKGLPTDNTKDTTVNIVQTKKTNNKLQVTSPSAKLNSSVDIVDTSPPFQTGLVQDFKEDISKNENNNSYVFNHTTKRKRKKNLVPKYLDEIKSRDIKYPIKISSTNKSHTPYGALAPNKPFNLLSVLTNITKQVNSIRPTNRLDIDKNTSMAAHVSPVAKSSIDLKENKTDPSSDNSIPMNAARSYPIKNLLERVFSKTTNKGSLRKRKRKVKPGRLANKMNFSHVLRGSLSRENQQNITKDQSNIPFDAAGGNETLSFKNSSDIRITPNVLHSYPERIVKSGEGSDKKEPQTVSQDIKLENYNNNQGERMKEFETKTITQNKEGVVDKNFEHAKINLLPIEENIKPLLFSSNISKENLHNGEVTVNPLTSISDSRGSNNLVSNKEYVQSHVTNLVPLGAENNIISQELKSNRTDEYNNISLLKETVNAKKKQDNSQLHNVKNFTEESNIWSSNLKNKEVQGHSKISTSERLSNKDFVNKQYSLLSHAGLSNKTIEKGYSSNVTSLLSDEIAKNDSDKHPIEELLESLVTVTPVKKSMKRRKKKRVGQKKLIQDELFDSENQLQTAKAKSIRNEANNTSMIQPKTSNETNITSTTQAKTVNEEHSVETLLTPLDLNSSMTTKERRRQGTSSEAKDYLQNGKTNFKLKRGNDSYKKGNVANTKNEHNYIPLPVSKIMFKPTQRARSTADEPIKQEFFPSESQLFKQKGPANLASVKSNSLYNSVNNEKQRIPIELLMSNAKSKPTEINSSIINKQSNKQSTSFGDSHYLHKNKANLSTVGVSNTFHVGNNKDQKSSLYVPVPKIQPKPTASKLASAQPKEHNTSSLEPTYFLQKRKTNLEVNNSLPIPIIKEQQIPIQLPNTNVPSNRIDLESSRVPDDIHIQQKIPAPKSTYYPQKRKVNLEPQKVDNSSLIIREQRNTIQLPITNVPSRPTDLNTSMVPDGLLKQHNMSALELKYYPQKSKANIDSQKGRSSSDKVSFDKQLNNIQSLVTYVSTTPTNLNPSRQNNALKIKRKKPSFKLENILLNSKGNFKPTESSRSFHVVESNEKRDSLQLTNNKVQSKPMSTTTSKVNEVQPNKPNMLSFKSQYDLQTGSINLKAREVNNSFGENFKMRETSTKLPIFNRIPSNYGTTTIASYNSYTADKENKYQLQAPTTRYTNSINVPFKINTHKNSTIFLNHSYIKPIIHKKERKNVTFNGMKDLATAEESNEKYFYLKSGAKNQSSHTVPKKNEREYQTTPETRQLSNNENNAGSYVSRYEKMKVNEGISKARTTTTKNQNQPTNIGQIYRPHLKPSTTDLISESKNKTFLEQTTLASEVINPEPKTSYRSMNTTSFEAKGTVQSPLVINKTSTDAIQQNVQVSNGKVLEALLHKIYNTLNLYLQKTSTAKNGIGNNSNNQEPSVYSVSKNRTQETLLNKSQLKHVTKHSFLSQENLNSNIERVIKIDQKPSLENLVKAFSTSHPFKIGKPIVVSGTPTTNENPNDNTTRNQTSTIISNVLESTKQSPNLIYNDIKHSNDFKKKNKILDKTHTNLLQTVNSETTRLTESTTLMYNKFKDKIMENNSTVVKIKPHSNRTLVESSKKSKPSSTKSSPHSQKYESQGINKENLKATKLENGLEVEDVRKLVNKLNYVLKGYGHNRSLKVEENKRSHASRQVNDNNDKISSKSELLNANPLIVPAVDGKSNKYPQANVNSKNNIIVEPLKQATGQHGLPYSATSINASEVNLHNASGGITNKDSNRNKVNLNGEAQIKQVNSLSKDNLSQKEFNTYSNQNTLNSKPTTKLVGNLTSLILVAKNNSNCEKLNTRIKARSLLLKNVTASFDVHNEVNKSKPETTAQNNDDVLQKSVLEEKIPKDVLPNKNIAQELYENGRLHIIITPLDKKPNISVEISKENKNSSTIKKPLLFDTKTCNTSDNGSQIVGENKTKSMNQNRSTGSSVNFKNLQTRGLRHIFKNVHYNNIHPFPVRPHLTYKQDNINRPNYEEFNHPYTRATKEMSKHGISRGTFNVDNSIAKDFSFDVADSDKVTNRKMVTKKEEVVEVNEKMKQNKILGKSKTVQTIKTEVSSVDYV